jgi:FdrA protein
MKTKLRLCKDTYVDSVVQLGGTRAMRERPGVDWAAAAMATPANIATLRAEGFGDEILTSAGANDLVLAVRAESDEAADQALEAAGTSLFGSRETASTSDEPAPPRTIERAVERQPGSNVAVISVPGDYAALEAHKALSADMDVLLFSDNVSIEQEIELKDRAVALGRLVMGPGAGTAMLGGTCLGFANVVRPGRVGVIAAAGTGAQEAMSLLDRWGVGVSAVIGLGGRDLTDTVDGRMAKPALRRLREDEGTDTILLVSKPPAARVARELVDAAGDSPFVASFIGLRDDIDVPENVRVSRTLESGVLETLGLLGLPAPDVVGDLPERIASALAGLDANRTLVRGLFSGGTLCYESLVILSEILGPVHSNTPLDKSMGLPAPAGSNVCLDLGEEEYTRGHPHPMIDPEARVELLSEQGKDDQVAAILLDIVIGYGAHADPAAQLAPACEAIHHNGGPQVIAYVLGTPQDPQGFERQRRRLEDAGCIVTETAARASLAAAALALRDPEVVRRRL